MHRVKFDKGFKPADLLNGVEFEIDNEEHDLDDSEEFNDDRFNDFKDCHIESKILTSELRTPFSELKLNMIPISEDGLVKKEVLKTGVGIKIPEKSVIIMHYDAFLDNTELPYDSTRFRNRPHKCLIGDGNLIPGLEIGVQTMKKEEISRILIPPQYAYGTMGCPPRIPGNAEIVYVVEIINFFESKDAIEFEEMTPEEQKKAPFEKIVSVFHCEHQIANDLFRHNHYRPAIARYRKMCSLLEDVSVANQDEDEQRNKYLQKLYMNLCISYINIKNSQKAIIYGKLALALDESYPKALYRLGCAFALADEFDKAKHYLLKASQHKAYGTVIEKVLLDLEKKRLEHQQWEDSFCKRMFQNDKVSKKATVVSPEVQEFQNVLEEQFQKFIQSEEKELSFSSGYSDWQIDVVKELAQKYDLSFISKFHNEKIIKVVKK